jgi:starch synthase (maltosyl-transferring)
MHISGYPLTLGDYRLRIDPATGALTTLQLGDGPDALGHGAGSFPILPAVDLAYQPLDAQPRYLSHELIDNELVVRIGLGPLVLHDRYRAAGGLIARRVRVENASRVEVQLTGLRVGLSGVSLGDPNVCRFEAPGNGVRPRLPLSMAASQAVSWHVSPDRGSGETDINMHFAPGSPHLWGSALSDAPDVGPGLLIVHNPSIDWSLLTWYLSEIESGRPWVSGDGIHATLGFDWWLAGWIAPGEALEGGTQYILLHEGDYQSTLARFRAASEQTGITPPIYGEVDRALDWTGVYEVHPGQFGGFAGLRKALPRIKELGIDTLYLLPVMAHRNKLGRPWDENWRSLGSPYAIHDYEKLEPTLGSEAEFAELVSAAHDLGLRVLVDFVAQGCSLESRYVTEHPEWFARDEAGGLVHSHGWDDTWSFDWANRDFHAYMLGWALRYVRDYDIDGFRVDAPHGKEPNWSRAIEAHASHTNLGARGLLEDLRRALLKVKPDAALYCELFGPLWVRSHDIANDYHPYAMALALFQQTLTPYEFGEYLRDYWAIMPCSAEGYPTPRICFTETHDTRGWPAYALRGSDVAQALLGILVMAGFVPMIWSGQEARQESFIRGLLLARRESETLRRGQFLFNEVTVDDEGHYRRKHGEDPAGQVFTLIRHDADTVLLGLASLLPEQATFRFGLPVDKLPIRPDVPYCLRDLITNQVWNEYGRAEWRGAELASFHLTPRMYRPYIFQIEPVAEG